MTPKSLPSVFEASFSEMRGSFVREATNDVEFAG